MNLIKLKEYSKLTIDKHGQITTSINNLSARKIPLYEIRKRIFEEHASQRINILTLFNSLDRSCYYFKFWSLITVKPIYDDANLFCNDQEMFNETVLTDVRPRIGYGLFLF